MDGSRTAAQSRLLTEGRHQPAAEVGRRLGAAAYPQERHQILQSRRAVPDMTHTDRETERHGEGHRETNELKDLE